MNINRELLDYSSKQKFNDLKVPMGKEMLEKWALEQLETFLLAKGIALKEIKYEPNGEKTFPDFDVILDGDKRSDDNPCIEVTQLENPKVLCDEEFIECNEYKFNDLIDYLRKEIGPNAFGANFALIHFNKPFVKERTPKFAKKLSKKIKNGFKNGKKKVSFDFGIVEFHNREKFLANLFEKNFHISMYNHIFSLARAVSNLEADSMVVFAYRQIVFFEDGKDFEKTFQKKINKKEKAIEMGYISKNKKVWLLIVAKDFHNQYSVSMAVKNCGVNFKSYFDRVFVVLLCSSSEECRGVLELTEEPCEKCFMS